MSKILNFFKKHWWVVLIMIAVLPFGTAFAINTVAEGYRISKGDVGTTALDWGGGNVWNITSANLSFLSDDMFIPTATKEERDSFQNSAIGQQVLGLGGCTPSCGSKVGEGGSCDDGCGGLCSSACASPLTCDSKTKTCKSSGTCTTPIYENQSCDDGSGRPCACDGVLSCDPGKLMCGTQPGCHGGTEGESCANGDWGIPCPCASGFTCDSNSWTCTSGGDAGAIILP